MGEYNVFMYNAKMPDNIKVEQFCSPFLSHNYVISTFEGLNFILKLHYNVKKSVILSLTQIKMRSPVCKPLKPVRPWQRHLAAWLSEQRRQFRLLAEQQH
jgi:hypothetical protein